MTFTKKPELDALKARNAITQYPSTLERYIKITFSMAHHTDLYINIPNKDLCQLCRALFKVAKRITKKICKKSNFSLIVKYTENTTTFFINIIQSLIPLLTISGKILRSLVCIDIKNLFLFLFNFFY